MNLSELRIDLNLLIATPDLIDALEERFINKKKYQHEVLPLDEVEFFMVPDNYTIVSNRLAEIRLRMPKFICLNDDMNKTHDPPQDTVKSLQEFYLSYFPVASPFEWTGETNPYHRNFSTIFEWRELQAQMQEQTNQELPPRHYVRVWIKVIVCILCGLVVISITGYCHRLFSTIPFPLNSNLHLNHPTNSSSNTTSRTHTSSHYTSTIAHPSHSSSNLLNRTNHSRNSIV
jgi:hypothetical protein